MNKAKILTLLALSVLSVVSCTQFEDIGSDLVNDDELQIDTDTDLDYTLTTYVRDSLIAYSRKGEESDSVPTTHILGQRSEEHTSELQSRPHLVCRLLLEEKE